MSTQIYNNIPSEKKASSSDLTVLIFDTYYQSPIDLKNDELVVMQGFFEKRGFASVAAENTAITILKQAKKDGYNAMQIMDTLSGLTDVEISALVAEILNYNRYKSSALGITKFYEPSEEVSRNILP